MRTANSALVILGLMLATSASGQYQSRTDFQTVQVTTVPNIGGLIGANTVVTDPDFGSRIARITDANTNPNKKNTTYVTSSAGSASANPFNTDSTFLVLQDQGSITYPLSYSSATMQAARLYAANFPATGGMIVPFTAWSWSYVNRTLLYVSAGNAARISSYDFSSPTPPSPATVFDFTSSSNCLPAAYAHPTWATFGQNAKDDQTFAAAYSVVGGQGTGTKVVAYRAGQGCVALDTSTGIVTGDWGQTGTINAADRFTIHDVLISKDGNWVAIVRQQCTGTCAGDGHYFWQVGTTNVVFSTPSQRVSGHFTTGYSGWINNSGAPPNQGAESWRPFTDASQSSLLTVTYPAGLVSPFDVHQSWNNVQSGDAGPVFITSESPTTPFPAAWYDEILGLATDGSGTVWRFAHSFLTNKNASFSTDHGIGSVSQDGQAFIFSSDWMGTLGSPTGSQACTPPGCRGDVFIVELN